MARHRRLQAARADLNGRARALAAFGIIAYAVWVAAWVIEGERVAGYDWVDDYISELAATDASTASVMVPVFIVLGLGTIATGLALRAAIAPPSVPVLTVIAGFGVICAGVFQCDAGCPSLTEGSTENLLHGVTSIVYFVGLIAAMFVLARAERRHTPWLARFSLAGGAVTTVGLLLVSALDGDAGTGLAQRTAIVVIAAWTITVSARVIVGQAERAPTSA